MQTHRWKMPLSAQIADLSEAEVPQLHTATMQISDHRVRISVGKKKTVTDSGPLWASVGLEHQSRILVIAGSSSSVAGTKSESSRSAS